MTISKEDIYKKEYLKESDKRFLDGFDSVVENSLKPAKENYLYDFEGSVEAKTATSEILDDFMRYLFNVIDFERQEQIANIIDDYTEGEYEQLLRKATVSELKKINENA